MKIFACFSNLKNVNLSAFNTKNVVNMNCMFEECSHLALINFSSFEITNDVNHIFKHCINLKVIELNKTYGTNIIDKVNQKKTKIIYI